MALLAGQIVLDRYVVGKKLGEGGFGAVWQAVDRVERRPVAIKVLRPHATSLDRRRFEIEAGVLARLRHPNIVQLHDFVTGDDGELLLVTELLGRETLGDWVKREEPGIDDVVAVSRQLCSALTAAHREGVLHRDLKPTNVLFERDARGGPKVTVLDFGIAKLTGREQPDITKTGEVLGTPGYMSPEQLLGRKVGPATDLYSLGLLMFVMLEGRAAFTGASPLELGMAHLTQPAPAATRGPRELRELVAALLSKEPQGRPGSALVVERRLAQLQGDDVTGETTVKQRASFVAPAMAALVVLSVVVWAVWDRDPPTDRVSRPTLPSRVEPTPPPVRPEPTPTRAALENVAVASDRCVDRAAPLGRHNRLPPQSPIDPGYPLLHYVPSAYDGETRLPLVAVFHRRGTTAEQTLDETLLAPIADKHGFIVAVPQSKRNDLTALGATKLPWKLVGDSYFMNELDELLNTLCVDESRLYLVALNQGVRATDLLLCERDRVRVEFAAIVESGGRFSNGNYTCRRDDRNALIPRLEFADEHDRYIPIAGGGPKRPCSGSADFHSWDEQVAFMRQQHGCRGASKPVVVNSDEARCREWDCDVPYRVCEFDRGRFWSPQPWQAELTACYGSASDVPRAEIAWDFLSRFSVEDDGDEHGERP